MKNIFSKTNAPYLVSGALATGTLLASGIFAVAPYVVFLAPVAALSVSLPFIVGCAVFSAVIIALSSVAINKNNTISQKDTEISNLENQLTQAKRVIKAKNKAIANLNEDDILKRQERREKKQEKVLDYADLRNLFKEEEKKEEVLDFVALGNLFEDAGSQENQPAKEENSQSWTAWIGSFLSKPEVSAASVDSKSL